MSPVIFYRTKVNLKPSEKAKRHEKNERRKKLISPWGIKAM